MTSDEAPGLTLTAILTSLKVDQEGRKVYLPDNMKT